MESSVDLDFTADNGPAVFLILLLDSCSDDARASKHVPKYKHETTWTKLGMPEDSEVTVARSTTNKFDGSSNI